MAQQVSRKNLHVGCSYLALMVSMRNLLVVSTWLWWYPGGTCWLLLPGSVGIQEGAEWNLVDEYVDESIRRLPQLQDKNTTLTHLNVHLFSLYNRDPDLHWLITASGTWNVLVVIRSDPIPYYLAFITKITIQNIFFKLIFSVNIYSKVKITSYKCVVHEDLQYNGCCVHSPCWQCTGWGSQGYPSPWQSDPPSASPAAA